MAYKPRNILVTGGAGFIGSHYIIETINRLPDIQIINLDKLTYASNLENLSSVSDHPCYQFIQGDIVDKFLVEKILQDYQIDTIVNFAAESHVDRSIAHPDIFVQSNIVGTHNLLHCALQYWQAAFNLDATQCRFHHISTDEVYGSLSAEESPFTEESPYQPNSPYSASKAASDHLVRAFQHTYQLPTTVSNCSNNYGANQHEEKLIPKVIRCCFESKQIPIYNDGSNIRDWIAAEDHSHAVNAIITRGEVGRNYNIGSSCEMSNLQLVKLICAVMDEVNPSSAAHEHLITFVKDRPGHDWRYAIDSSLLRQHTGWTPECQFQDQIRKVISSKLSCYVA